MTNPTPPGQVPEALRLADELEQRWNENMTCAELDAAAELRRLHAENEALRTQQPAPAGAARSAEELARDLKKAIETATELREQLTLMEEHARGEVWRWQGDDADDLATMGNRMGVLIYASDLRNLIATTPQPAPATQQAGWKLVPMEPTKTMLDAAYEMHEATARAIWKAMVQFSPATPQPSPTAQAADLQPIPAEWGGVPSPECGLEGAHTKVEWIANTLYSMHKMETLDSTWRGQIIMMASAASFVAKQLTYAAQAAESVPAVELTTNGGANAQLDTDSNPSGPGQQRDVAGSVAMGQPMGHRQNQAAGHPIAQGDKLLTVAERNIRSFLRSAQFKSESDREAALNCVDVLWAAARTSAESVGRDAEASHAARAIAIFCAATGKTEAEYCQLKPSESARWESAALAARSIT